MNWFYDISQTAAYKKKLALVAISNRMVAVDTDDSDVFRKKALLGSNRNCKQHLE